MARQKQFRVTSGGMKEKRINRSAPKVVSGLPEMAKMQPMPGGVQKLDRTDSMESKPKRRK